MIMDARFIEGLMWIILIPLILIFGILGNILLIFVSIKRENGSTVPCPYCGKPVPMGAIDCVHCKREIFEILEKKKK
jgi:hypothetical protein